MAKTIPLKKVEEFRQDLIAFARTVVRLDKTPEYSYKPEIPDAYGNDRYRDNDGAMPSSQGIQSGSKWLTPREIAEQLIKRLEAIN